PRSSQSMMRAAWAPGKMNDDAISKLGPAGGERCHEEVGVKSVEAYDFHPDKGGDADTFKRLANARDSALWEIGCG
ncbi:MAG: hypothetical protein ACR2RE_17150, partial [Geminicoccaceae bacterium]